MTASLQLTARDRTLSLSDLRLTKTHRAANLNLRPHSHEYTNVGLCLRGLFKETVGATWTPMDAQTFVCRPAGELHADQYGPHETTCLIFEIAAPVAERIGPVGSRLKRTIVTRSPTVGVLAARIGHEFDGRDALRVLAIESLFYELLVHAVREDMRQGDRRAAWLTRVRDLLHDRFLDDLSLADMAAVADVSVPHFCRSFREHFNATPAEYVRDLRLIHAVHLIQTPDLPLAEIAITCGFYDQSHFSHAFKRRFGVPPGHFRHFPRLKNRQ